MEGAPRPPHLAPPQRIVSLAGCERTRARRSRRLPYQSRRRSRRCPPRHHNAEDPPGTEICGARIRGLGHRRRRRREGGSKDERERRRRLGDRPPGCRGGGRHGCCHRWSVCGSGRRVGRLRLALRPLRLRLEAVRGPFSLRRGGEVGVCGPVPPRREKMVVSSHLARTRTSFRGSSRGTPEPTTARRAEPSSSRFVSHGSLRSTTTISTFDRIPRASMMMTSTTTRAAA